MPTVLSMVLFCIAISCASQKPRVIICTDIGGGDEDDMQSMVHYFVYSDLFETEGLISSPPDHQIDSVWYRGRKKHIVDMIEVYEKDYPNLKTYCKDYPKPSYLRAITFQGATDGGEPSAEKSTEASLRIIKRANKKDSRPLWILVWGSMTDVAQALHDDPGIKKSVRVYSIGGWNTYAGDPKSREYIALNHKDLWWIENDHTFRGMYNCAPDSGEYSNAGFILAHLKGHGALGNFYSNLHYKTIKMGDTPSLLYLLSPMIDTVGNWEDPTSESWGGQFRQTDNGQNLGPNFWTDIHNNGKLDGQSVNKWRQDFLAHWAKRMDRCSAPVKKR